MTDHKDTQSCPNKDKTPRGVKLNQMTLFWLKIKKAWAENPNNPKNKEAKS